MICSYDLNCHIHVISIFISQCFSIIRKKRKAGKDGKKDADEQGLVDGEEEIDQEGDEAAKVNI